MRRTRRIVGSTHPQGTSLVTDNSPEARVGRRIRPQPNGCWLYGEGDDYRQLSVGGRLVLAHRYVYEILREPLDQDTVLHHTCRTPPCVNPDHLEPMSNSDHASLHNQERYAS